jgi:hypothetical protein
MADMKTARCPSCNQLKYSAARSSDCLCDACAGRITSVVDELDRQGILPGMGTPDIPTPEQRARDARDTAVDRVQESHAEWVLLAILMTKRVAKVREYFTTDDVQEYCKSVGFPAPRDGRAWGAVMRAAAKEKFVYKTGRYINSRSSKCHARPKAEWQSAIFGVNG